MNDDDDGIDPLGCFVACATLIAMGAVLLKFALYALHWALR